MYVYEVIDHQIGKIIGIYTNSEAATAKVIELTGKVWSTRYKIWPNYVREVIYDADLDCMYAEDQREREFEDYDMSDVNAVPF